MELRSCIHLHFINALKGGFTRKTLNVACGKPVLRFKNVKDVCEELDAKNGVLFPTIPPKDEFRGLHLDSARVMIGCTNTRNVVNIKVKSEPEDSGSDCNDGGDGDLECFGNMTLKLLKQTWKSKKRKRSKSCSPVKQECPILQANEEDHDLLKPLSSLKSKRSKNAKAKTKSKRMKNCTSTMSQSAIMIVKTEESSCEDEPLQFNQFAPARKRDITLDVPEPGCSNFQNTSCFDDDNSLVNGNKMGYYGAMPTDYPMTAVECASDNGSSYSPANENHSCIVYEPLCKDMEDDPMPLQVISNSCWDVVKWNDTEIYSYERLDFWPEMESTIQGYITNSAHHNLYTEGISSDNTTSEDASLCQINNETRNDFSQFMEPTRETDACISEAYNKDDLPSSEEASANSVSDFDLGSDSGLVAVANQISMSKEEERQSQMSASADAKISLSSGVNLCEPTQESATATTGEYLTQQRPQRLFPTRKSISPTSQEKLCKAMNSIELHDGQSMCKGELNFGKQAESTNHGAAGPSHQIRKPKVSITPKTIRNYKNEKSSSNGPRSDPKASNGFSTGPARFTTGCTSIRTCTDSAVAFSQRQMHDIECITTKLTDELQIMKEIAEERLPGTYATSLKYNADEARMAIRNVTRVEAAAKKLLSMMSRDCDRFCKIMKMADQKNSNASEDVGNNHTKTTIVNKERKKITFADEAGEDLCHVKVFDKEMISSSISDPSQNQEVLVMTRMPANGLVDTHL